MRHQQDHDAIPQIKPTVGFPIRGRPFAIKTDKGQGQSDVSAAAMPFDQVAEFKLVRK